MNTSTLNLQPSTSAAAAADIAFRLSDRWHPQTLADLIGPARDCAARLEPAIEPFKARGLP